MAKTNVGVFVTLAPSKELLLELLSRAIDQDCEIEDVILQTLHKEFIENAFVGIDVDAVVIQMANYVPPNFANGGLYSVQQIYSAVADVPWPRVNPNIRKSIGRRFSQALSSLDETVCDRKRWVAAGRGQQNQVHYVYSTLDEFKALVGGTA